MKEKYKYTPNQIEVIEDYLKNKKDEQKKLKEKRQEIKNVVFGERKKGVPKTVQQKENRRIYANYKDEIRAIKSKYSYVLPELIRPSGRAKQGPYPEAFYQFLS